MHDFKIAAAQTASVRGDVDGNVGRHAIAMEAAAKHGVGLLIFPELSLTGYEPDLAAELAMTPADMRLEPLAELARRRNIDAIVGAPLQNGANKPKLGAIVIARDGAAKTYHKMHLGGSEPEFFEPGDKPLLLAASGHRVGVAICADSSKPSHPETYASLGANVYAAGVFLTDEWYESDAPRLAAYAARYSMLIVMANQADSTGSYESVGKSAIWNPEGDLVVQAQGAECALLTAHFANGEWRGEIIAA